MSDEVRSFLPSAVALGVVGVIALLLTLARGWADESARHPRDAVRAAVAAVLSQAAHFAEELLAGLHQRLPGLFGLDPMPLGPFVWFNLAWLAVWGLSARGLAARRRAALFPLWFLGIACVANGVVHPAVAVLTAGYFPGLATSPVVALAGVVLLRRLLLVTAAADPRPGAGAARRGPRPR